MIIIILIWLIFPSITLAEDIVVGKTYSIVEKDSLRELEEKSQSVNWESVTKVAREKLKDYRPADFYPLPHTEKPNKYKTSVIHTVEHEVADEQGNIIYPRGYQFNPLDYVTLPYEMIFIDGNDKRHIDWADTYIKNHAFVQVYIVNGPVFDVMSTLDRKVFYAGHRITDRLNIQTVPSVLYQDGNQMSVEQINLKNNDNGNNKN